MYSIPAASLLLLTTLSFNAFASSALPHEYTGNADGLFSPQARTGIQMHSDNTLPLSLTVGISSSKPAHLSGPLIGSFAQDNTPYTFSTASWLTITGLLSLGLISRRRTDLGQGIESSVKKTLSTHNPSNFNQQPLTRSRFLVKIHPNG